MKLHDLQPAPGSRKPRTRVGRGIAAGKGKTAGRGTKGQKARAGGGIPAWFEGGQTPLHMRIPKLRGFKNRFKIEYEVVNIGAIGALADRGAFEFEDTKKSAKSGPITVNQDILRAVGLVRTLNKPLKILGAGELSVPLFVVADAFTASARAKIEAAGGSVNVLEVPSSPLAALGVTPETADAKATERPTPAKGKAKAEEKTAPEAVETRLTSPRPRPRRPPRPQRPSRPTTPSPPPSGARRPPPRRHPPRRRPTRPRRHRRRPPRPRPMRTSRPTTPPPPTSPPRPTTGHGRRHRVGRRNDPRERHRAALRRRRLTRVRIPSQCLSRARHPPADLLCPRPADRLPPPGVGPDPGRRQDAAPAIRRGQRPGRPARPLLGRRPVPFLRRRAGHEPVHQRLDHHAVDEWRGAVAPGAQPRG